MNQLLIFLTKTDSTYCHMTLVKLHTPANHEALSTLLRRGPGLTNPFP